MLFGPDGALFLPLAGWLGVFTAILGALGALAQTDLKRMAAFLVVSGVGVMLIGLGLGTPEGLSGAIVYAVHSIVVMTALFMALGLAERLSRTGGLAKGGNLYASHGLVAGLFLVFGLSAAGLPPFSGFWPKLILIEAALAIGGVGALAAAIGVILSGLFTTIVVGRAWALVFLKPADEETAAGEAGPPAAALTVPLAVLAVVVVGLGLFPNLVVTPAEHGAAGLLDPDPYIQRVLDME
jgi:multicomponent Na+:H+ antiporter subunit D